MTLLRHVVDIGDMHGVKANFVVLFSLIHIFGHVRDVVTEPVNREPGVQCYTCHDGDPDAERNVVSLQSLVLLRYIVSLYSTVL